MCFKIFLIKCSGMLAFNFAFLSKWWKYTARVDAVNISRLCLDMKVLRCFLCLNYFRCGESFDESIVSFELYFSRFDLDHMVMSAYMCCHNFMS